MIKRYKEEEYTVKVARVRQIDWWNLFYSSSSVARVDEVGLSQIEKFRPNVSMKSGLRYDAD